MLLSHLLPPGPRLRRRISRAQSRTTSFSDAVARVADPAAHRESERLLALLQRDLGRLEERAEALPLTDTREFAWLWKDTEKSVQRVEATLVSLRTLLDDHPLLPPEPAAPASPEPATTCSSAPLLQPMETRAPQLDGAMRRYTSGLPCPSLPAPPVTAPRPPSPERPPIITTTRAPARPRFDAEATQTLLRQDLDSWTKFLRGITRKLRTLEGQPRAGFAPARWRQLIQTAQRAHRVAAERAGICERWIRGPASLLRGNRDWVREFRLASRSVTRARQALDALETIEPETPHAAPPHLNLIPISPVSHRRNPRRGQDAEDDGKD